MIVHGLSEQKLQEFADESFDALITDPPAGISFMAKSWDKDKGGRDMWIAWMQSIMQECLRVLKPGAHGLVWALPRTSHWTATALENAGFEIRDSVVHIFGSGFPKSTDISKQIDKMKGATREIVGFDPIAAAKANKKLSGEMNSKYRNSPAANDNGATITAPSSPEAKQWDGWGTNLKPAFEPWLLITKPFTTVPLDAILKEIDSELRDFICLQLPAKFVQTHSTLSNRDSKEETFASAQWLANISHILKSQELEPKTDISISPEAVTIFLSIVTLWNSILDVVLKNQSMSITRMETKLIIELKILNYSILRNTRVNIIMEGNRTNGEMLPAKSVQRELCDAYSKLKGLMEPFVQEDASLQVEDCKMLQANQLEHGQGIEKADLKNSHEHYILIRKPLGEKTVAKNVLEHGTGALNIDASRIGNDKIKLNQVDFTNAHGNNLGAGVKQPFTGEIKESIGRFPANLLLSHHPECKETCSEDCAVKGLDEHSGPCKTGNIKPGTLQGFGGGANTFGEGRVERSFETDAATGASRFFYQCHPDCAVKGLDDHTGELKGPWGKDSIQHVGKDGSTSIFGQGGVNSQNEIRGQESGGASRFFYVPKADLKNSHEHYILIRKPLGEKTVAKNVLEHGTGALNIDASRIGTNPEYAYPNGPGGSSFSIGAGTDGTRTEPVSSTQGRFPANLLLSHHPECELIGTKNVKGQSGGPHKKGSSSKGITGWEGTEHSMFKNEIVDDWQCHPECAVKGLDEHSGILKSAGEYTDSLLKPETEKFVDGNSCFGKDQKQKRNNDYANEQGGASRFFYCAKASRKNRGPNNTHPTVKSTKLMEYLIRLICPPNGRILDPFAGSGSTLVAAKRLGFEFVGIEQDQDYVKIALERINNTL